MVWPFKWNFFFSNTFMWSYLFSMAVVLNMESVDEILWCWHSTETSHCQWYFHMALLSVKYVAFLNFWVCGWNPLVWPLKWNLFRSAVLSHRTIYYLGEAPSKGFATLRNVPKLLFYGDRIGHSKSVRFRLSRPFDEVRAELVWDISRSLRVLYIISSGKPRQSHSWFLLRSRFENATPNLCWVSCAINKGDFFETSFSSSTHICPALRRLLTIWFLCPRRSSSKAVC